jgi:hypothetical protein
MVSINDLDGPVRTVADVVRQRKIGAHFVAHRDIGLDPQGNFWLRREGKVDLLPGLRKKIAIACVRDSGLRLSSSQTIATDKVQRLADPVDDTTWIKVQGTF